MDAASVERAIVDAIPEADVTVAEEEHEDERSEGAHYQLRVISPAFEDASTVDRHRMVHDALGDALGDTIHAVEIDARTPDEV